MDERDGSGQIFRIGTVRYAEGLWRMRRHGPVKRTVPIRKTFPAVHYLLIIKNIQQMLMHYNK